MNEVTVGVGGAAGDGLDKTGDTLARTAARLGLHVYAYNSYQSVIRGGHIWLRVRLGEEPLPSHGDHLDALIALNQDSIERHAPEIEPGGVLLYNADRLRLNLGLAEGVRSVPLPVGDLTRDLGRVQPIMQNTVALGALFFLIGLEFEVAAGVLADTFRHKGQAVVDQNVALLRAGHGFVRERLAPIAPPWTFSRTRRPFITGNEALAIGAVAAGCKFYSAYPMTPASSILHWMAAHAERCGVVVKQCEDELAVANMAIGAGYAGVRAMCGTSGGGFALMTEAIGMAGMIEAPVVFVEVQRAGPSTGIPTKTEQGDLNQVLGASQGDFPRIVIAPADTADCFHAVVEAFNLAETYQLPVIIISDLLLSEHPQTVEPDVLRARVPISRGRLLAEWRDKDGPFKRYAFTPSGISPRALPGTAGAEHVAATDEHDEEGILISDIFTNPAVRRKIAEKRMKKLDLALRDLPAPRLVGPADAAVTLVGWGSTRGVIAEAIQQLSADGLTASQVHFKYLLPFHAREAAEILARCKRTIAVENNSTGQFARYLRGETGHAVSAKILKYDGEPFEPRQIAGRVKAILDGQPMRTDVSEDEARGIAFHYLRTHLGEELRPGRIERSPAGSQDEPLWRVEIVHRDSGRRQGELRIGAETGSTRSWEPAA